MFRSFKHKKRKVSNVPSGHRKKKTNKQTNKQKHTHRKNSMEKQNRTNKQTNKQTKKQTNKQTNSKGGHGPLLAWLVTQWVCYRDVMIFQDHLRGSPTLWNSNPYLCIASNRHPGWKLKNFQCTDPGRKRGTRKWRSQHGYNGWRMVGVFSWQLHNKMGRVFRLSLSDLKKSKRVNICKQHS